MTYSFEPVAVPSPEELEALAAQRRLDPSEAEPVELPDLAAAPMHGAGSGAAQPSLAERHAAALEAARAEAHQSGVEKGRQVEAERVRTLIEAVKFVIEELRVADERREREATDRMAALATAVAGHLIEREVRTSPEIVSDLVRRAVAEFPVNEPLSVHLNPSDLALLSTGLEVDQRRGNLTSGQTVRWIPDPGVRSGGCLVEGSERVVDARLTQILERVFRALTDG